MSALRHIQVALVALCASGCVLLVKPYDIGEHCTIAGQSGCATCIRTKCQSSVDACCGATGCGIEDAIDLKSDVLDVVDACGRGDKNTCASRLSAARLGTQEEALRACVTTTCNAECVAGGTITNGESERATWTCSLPRTSDKDCASCIYDKCTTALDDCCSDNSCSKDTQLQHDMGSCIAGDQPGCAWLYEESQSGQAGVVRKCISDKCKDACVGDGRRHTDCSLQAGGSYCSCANAETAGGDECTPAKVGGKCVLGKDGCLCGEYSCSPGTYGCTCDFRGGGGGTTCEAEATSSNEPGSCCIRVDDRGVTCECTRLESTCYSGDFSVSTCSASDVMKALVDVLVDSCSH